MGILFCLPAAALAIEEVSLPADSFPAGITAGPDGAMWFTEQGTNKIGRATPPPVDITHFTIPTSSSGPADVIAGPDGRLWFTESGGSKIGAITTAGVITEYSLPPGSQPDGIVVGPDNAIWFTEPGTNKIGRITTLGVVTNEYSISTSSSGPAEITTGPDGRLWFTETQANKIGAITIGGTVTEYPVLTAGSEPTGITSAAGALWFTEFNAQQVGRITTTGTVTEFPTIGSGPSRITLGPDGALYFTQALDDSIGRLTTAGSATTYVFVPSSSEPHDIAPGADGALWFTELFGNRLGRLPFDVTAPESVVTSPALSSTTTVNLDYTATDAGGSRVKEVELWVQGPSGGDYLATATDISPVTPSFEYEATAGDGVYRFFTRARDHDQNYEGAPATPPDSTTLVDTRAPTSGARSPAQSSSTSLTVDYTASDGSGSGVTEVELWVQAPGAAGYALAATDTTPDTPSFSYQATGGDGTYRFYTRARDEAGHLENAPASGADTTTVVGTTAPGAASGAPSPPASGKTALRVEIAASALRVGSKGNVRIPLVCPASEPSGCRGRLTLRTVAKVNASARKRKVTFGATSFVIRSGRTTVVKVRLSKKHRRLVKRLKRVGVVVSVSVRDGSGNARTTKKTLTLKA